MISSLGSRKFDPRLYSVSLQARVVHFLASLVNIGCCFPTPRLLQLLFKKKLLRFLIFYIYIYWGVGDVRHRNMYEKLTFFPSLREGRSFNDKYFGIYRRD